ncbi:MAG: hypothetical protein JNJ88_10755 [Planctomycetes bacterium]|nr:hypothetical protein [Planctomycetota bacterium]
MLLLADDTEQLRRRLAPALSSANAVATVFDWMLRMLEKLSAGSDAPEGTSTGMPIRGREMICFTPAPDGSLKPFRMCGIFCEAGLSVHVPRIAFPRGDALRESVLRFRDKQHPVVGAFCAFFGPTDSVVVTPLLLGETLWGAFAMAIPSQDPHEEAAIALLFAATTVLSERLTMFTLPPAASRASAIGAERPHTPETFFAQIEAVRKRQGTKPSEMHLVAYAIARSPMPSKASPRRSAQELLRLLVGMARGSDFGCVLGPDVVVLCLDGCAATDLPGVVARFRERVKGLDPDAAKDGVATSTCAYAWVTARDLATKVVREARIATR